MADGETIRVGHGLRIVTDTVADIGVSTVEAAAVSIELVSIDVSIAATTTLDVASFTLAAADATSEVLQRQSLTSGGPIRIQYAPGFRPQLAGMRIDTEDVPASGGAFSYSIVYRVL